MTLYVVFRIKNFKWIFYTLLMNRWSKFFHFYHTILTTALILRMTPLFDETFNHKNHAKIKLETEILYSYTHTHQILYSPSIRLNIHSISFLSLSVRVFKWSCEICKRVAKACTEYALILSCSTQICQCLRQLEAVRFSTHLVWMCVKVYIVVHCHRSFNCWLNSELNEFIKFTACLFIRRLSLSLFFFLSMCLWKFE